MFGVNDRCRRSILQCLLRVQTAKYLFQYWSDAGRDILPDVLLFILNFQEHSIQCFVGKVIVKVDVSQD